MAVFRSFVYIIYIEYYCCIYHVSLFSTSAVLFVKLYVWNNKL